MCLRLRIFHKTDSRWTAFLCGRTSIKAALHVKSLINAKYKMLFSGKVMEYERRETTRTTASECIHVCCNILWSKKGMHSSVAGQKGVRAWVMKQDQENILSGFISVDRFQDALWCWNCCCTALDTHLRFSAVATDRVSNWRMTPPASIFVHSTAVGG